MLGFKAFDAAQGTLAGIELMHMIKKKQLVVEEGNERRTRAEQSTPWLPKPHPDKGNLPLHAPLSKICDRASLCASSQTTRSQRQSGTWSFCCTSSFRASLSRRAMTR